MVIHVRKLRWGPTTVRHIARHSVTLDEVKEVCYGDVLSYRVVGKKRLIVLGQTVDGRVLKIFLQPKRRGAFYLVTARPAELGEIALYTRMKGGGDNDKNKK